MGSLVKQGYFKKRVVVVSLIFIPSSHFQCYLSLGNPCVYLDVFCLFIYTISIIIVFASQKELSFVSSNKQMYDFYK